jgi:hypothetical protein
MTNPWWFDVTNPQDVFADRGCDWVGAFFPLWTLDDLIAQIEHPGMPTPPAITPPPVEPVPYPLQQGGPTFPPLYPDP